MRADGERQRQTAAVAPSAMLNVSKEWMVLKARCHLPYFTFSADGTRTQAHATRYLTHLPINVSEPGLAV